MRVFYKTLTGKVGVVVIQSTETVSTLKDRIFDVEGIPSDQLRLVYAGLQLEDARTLGYYNIQHESTVHVILRLRGGWIGTTTHDLGLVSMAQAVALYDWDGILPATGSREAHHKGLKFLQGEIFMVGRIVNGDWYQGYKDNYNNGYVPRNYVRIKKISDPKYRQHFGADAPMGNESDEQAFSEPQSSSRISFWRSIWNNSIRPTREIVTSNRPNLPISPIATPPAFDKTYSGSRIMVNFKVGPEDSDGNYTLLTTVSLNSAPGKRFSSLRINVQVREGEIVSLSPHNIVGPETEAQFSKDKSLQKTLNASLAAGNEPVASVNGSIGATFTRAEHVQFTRRTHASVQGNGVGSQNAYWVLKEDGGVAAQNGLDPEFNLEVKFTIRPVVISYNITLGTRRESRKERTRDCGRLTAYV